MKAIESNFDGLVGPTHNYAGLSYGNVASKINAQATSNPKAAALQGLRKMKRLADMGFMQGVIAPNDRPDISTLRRLGFSGSTEKVLKTAFSTSPHLFAACSSASSMWTANAATVSPSSDCDDNRIHFTPANLTNKFHRSIETDTTASILKAMFNNKDHFCHHQSLPHSDYFGDEGAANHTRLCANYSDHGVELFVYGKRAFDTSGAQPKKFPARQTLEACQAVSRLHGLRQDKVVYAQQNPELIDAGVFHNDVIAVGNRNVLFCHERAFLDKQLLKNDLARAYANDDFHYIEVAEQDVSVNDAINSYMFNTQILSKSDDQMMIVAPSECEQNKYVKAYFDHLQASDNPITNVEYFNLTQSMQNGGGPACLRLRVVLNEDELAATNQNVLLNDVLYERLCSWVNAHYRDRMTIDDLADVNLVNEVQAALDELTQILQLGSIYEFQQSPG